VSLLYSAIQAQIAWQAAPELSQRTRLGAPTEKGRRYAEAFRAIEAWARQEPRTCAEIADRAGRNLGRNPDYTTIKRWTTKYRIVTRSAPRSKNVAITDELIAQLSLIPSRDERVRIVREITGDKTFTLTRVRDILKSRAAYKKRKQARMAN